MIYPVNRLSKAICDSIQNELKENYDGVRQNTITLRRNGRGHATAFCWVGGHFYLILFAVLSDLIGKVRETPTSEMPPWPTSSPLVITLTS